MPTCHGVDILRKSGENSSKHTPGNKTEHRQRDGGMKGIETQHLSPAAPNDGGGIITITDGGIKSYTLLTAAAAAETSSMDTILALASYHTLCRFNNYTIHTGTYTDTRDLRIGRLRSNRIRIESEEMCGTTDSSFQSSNTLNNTGVLAGIVILASSQS